MLKNKKFYFFPKYSDKFIYIGAILLSVFGSAMIVSAELGESTGDMAVVSSTSIKQFANFLLGIFFLVFFSRFRVIRINTKLIWCIYFILLFALIITRAFAPAGGAYGWIRVGPLSVQPSEFAKVFIIVLAAKLFERSDPKNNIKNFKTFGLCAVVYVFVVAIIEKDLGSAVVIAGIAYCCALIPPYPEYKYIQNRMIVIIVLGIIVAVIALSSFGTKLLSSIKGSYMVNRFLASANPFAYQYDSGYHLVMSLVSFATGGLFGLGYGKSIHKYMNFPNPSTDFILPVIVEEMGIIFGFIPILICYGFILVPLIKHSIKFEYIDGKIVLLGTFMYFVLHFILNIGGVSGFIPLTGVPLLLISSGGSSLLACMCALGLSQNEIAYYLKKEKTKNENSSREV